MQINIAKQFLAACTFITTFSVFTTSSFSNAQEANVFGSSLFSGSFAESSFTAHNPQYTLMIGDKVYVQVWGAAEFDGEQVVDPQGNLFIPQVGPIRVAGIESRDLNAVVEKEVRKIYTNNVYIYISLVTAQPVKVYVTGFVTKPGLYSGLSSDSAIGYLDRAGGIDSRSGSYIDIKLKRGNQELLSFNLYDFILDGEMPSIQFQDGDVLVVPARKNLVSFSGLVQNPQQIEFAGQNISLHKALAIAGPLSNATHAIVQSNAGTEKTARYIPILGTNAANNTLIAPGDNITIISDKNRATIAVTVEGEHFGLDRLILPYGATISDLKAELEPNARSNISSLQLYRPSLAAKQKANLMEGLRRLEAQVLTARSDTTEEAQTRSQEAKLVLQFIERAKKIEPKGRVVMGNSGSAEQLVLENNDRIYIPSINRLVSVSGEVLFPNATVFNPEFSVIDYIDIAGGFTQRANDTRIILRKPNGRSEELDIKGFRKKGKYSVEAGDEILVLPAVDNKSLLYAKDIIQVIYQLALSAGVVLSIN